MSDSLARLVTKFNQIYEPLRSLNEQLAQSIVDNHYHPLWAYGEASREQIADFILNLEYQADDGEAGSTTFLPALVGLPAETCALVDQINTLRTELVEFLREADKESTPEGISLSKFLLDKVQLRRLNRKATARQFRVLPTKPDAVSFMWTQPASIKKLTKEEALGVAARRINKHNDSEQRDKLLSEQRLLERLNDGEFVARVYRPDIHPRVNTIIDRKRMPVKTALMPLFYPARANESLPDLAPLPELKTLKKRLKRSDTLLEQEPYAPLLNIYRYKR